MWIYRYIWALNVRFLPIPDKPYGFCGRKVPCLLTVRLILTRDDGFCCRVCVCVCVCARALCVCMCCMCVCVCVCVHVCVCGCVLCVWLCAPLIAQCLCVCGLFFLLLFFGILCIHINSFFLFSVSFSAKVEEKIHLHAKTIHIIMNNKAYLIDLII